MSSCVAAFSLGQERMVPVSEPGDRDVFDRHEFDSTFAWVDANSHVRPVSFCAQAAF